MHFFHITPEDIRKHPWMGVLIGFIGLTLISFVTYVAARDFLNFSKQKSPEVMDVENLKLDDPFSRKWVTLTNFTLDCAMVEKTMRTDLLEKAVEGPVYDTYILIKNNSGKELIVAIFHGDVACQDVQNQPLTGILTTTCDYSYGLAFTNTRLSKTTTANLVLRVEEGLGQSGLILAVGIFFDFAFLWFMIKSSRMWLKKWEASFEKIAPL
jgi:hypothetical protein